MNDAIRPGMWVPIMQWNSVASQPSNDLDRVHAQVRGIHTSDTFNGISSICTTAAITIAGSMLTAVIGVNAEPLMLEGAATLPELSVP